MQLISTKRMKHFLFLIVLQDKITLVMMTDLKFSTSTYNEINYVIFIRYT